MNEKIKEIAARLKALRDSTDTPVKTLADANKITEREYTDYESGKQDFPFTFLYNCAGVFGVDIGEIVTGESPNLSGYAVTRKGQGMPIEREAGFTYLHLARLFKDRTAEPFLVTAPYREAEQKKPVPLSRHKGQEMDFILEGSLKVVVKDRTEILGEGDFIYYDSGNDHGMIAAGGRDCKFLAIVLKPAEKEHP